MIKLILFIILIIPSSYSFAKTFKVLVSKGQILAFDKDGKEQSLNELSYGSTLKTKKSSFIKIKTPKNHLLVIGPSSELTLKLHTKEDKRTVLDIIKGQIRMKSEGPKENKAKFFIKTKTASMGIRGTEFHVIYNSLNKITSTVSYSGDVEMRKIHPRIDYVDEIDTFLDSDHTINIPKGTFSGSYIGYEKLGDPTKINPDQFKALEKNDSLQMKHELTSFKGEAPEEEVEVDLVPPPTEEFLPDRDLFLGEKIDARPGGYLDLNTGIYVSPPEDAPYDEKNEVYKMPEEKGFFDKLSGEYIPPLGLILHPLEGFKVVSQKVIGNLKKLRDKSVEGLEKFAGQLNEGFGISYLKDIHSFIKGNSLLSKLKFDFKAEFEYDSNIVQHFYNEVIKVTDQASIVWYFDARVGHRRFLNTKWYIHPQLFFTDKIHLRAHTPELKNQDHYLVGGRVELGRRGTFWGLPSQLSFSLGKYADRKRIQPSQEYENYLSAVQLGAKLFVKVDRHFSFHGELHFEDYQRREGYEGLFYRPSFYLQYRLSNRDYLRLKGIFSSRVQDEIRDERNTSRFEIAYFRREFFGSTDLYLNIGPTYSRPGKEFGKGKDETMLESTIKLKSNFYGNISYDLYYRYQNHYSDHRAEFNFNRHLTGLALNIRY